SDGPESVWTYDGEAGAYYRHQFYAHEPDLNLDNPAVRREIHNIIRFWLDQGLSGFRLDAAAFLLKRPTADTAAADDAFAYLRELEHVLTERRRDAILLAEANVPANEALGYFAPGAHVQCVTNFLITQYLFLALARQ